MFIKLFSIWVKLAPKPSSLLFHLAEFPTTMKVNNVSYEEAGKRVRDLQGQRQTWVCFMIWTIRTFFISWGINIAIYCLLSSSETVQRKGIVAEGIGTKVGEHFLSCVPQNNSLPTHFNYQYLYSYFHMKSRGICRYCCSEYFF